MIDIRKLKEKDIGRWVLRHDGLKTEIGRIKSWNDRWIFVVYHCDKNWDNFKDYTGCATRESELVFANKR